MELKFVQGSPMSDQRRSIILRAAERLIVHYGVKKTSVSDIAREADIGVGSVYLEFGSKSDIIEGISNMRHEAILDSMQNASGEGDTFATRFRNMMDARVHALIQFAEPGAHATELIHCTFSEGVCASFQTFLDRQTELVAALISAGATHGEFAPRDPKSTARAVLRAYRTFSPPAIYDERWKSMHQEHAEMHDLILTGLRGRV